jgi:hypothetical protein
MNPLTTLLDDGDGLPEFHQLLPDDGEGLPEFHSLLEAHTLHEGLVGHWDLGDYITDGAAVVRIVAIETAAGLVWGEPCWR